MCSENYSKRKNQQGNFTSSVGWKPVPFITEGIEEATRTPHTFQQMNIFISIPITKISKEKPHKWILVIQKGV